MGRLRWEVSQQSGPGPTDRLVDMVMRPLRTFAPFMLVGSVCSALVAAWLLAHSWAGVVIVAESPPGTSITMPAANTDTLVVYAVLTAGQPRPDVSCELATTSSAWVGMNFDLISPTSRGRTLEPVAKVFAGWHNGDKLTCTGDGVKTFVLGHNAGLTYLLQGLLGAFLAIGSGTFAFIGFASRRRWPGRSARLRRG